MNNNYYYLRLEAYSISRDKIKEKIHIFIMAIQPIYKKMQAGKKGMFPL